VALGLGGEGGLLFPSPIIFNVFDLGGEATFAGGAAVVVVSNGEGELVTTGGC
jgi:hypothetical protein